MFQRDPRSRAAGQVQAPIISRSITQKLYLYGALYVYKHLLIDIDPELFSIWNSFLYDLKEKMDKNSFIDINNYGFPKEWYNILIFWRKKNNYLLVWLFCFCYCSFFFLLHKI